MFIIFYALEFFITPPQLTYPPTVPQPQGRDILPIRIQGGTFHG